MGLLNLSAVSLTLMFALAGCGGNSPSTGTPPPVRTIPPTVTLTSVASGFSLPLALEQPNDGSGRLFVVEQGGRIRIIQNGSVLPNAFLDISGKVESDGEKGLLGLAFHPNYATNGFFYVNYTRRTNTGQLQTFISRYSRSTGNSQQADPNSELILLTVDQPFDNHNGGQLAFGPDGFLYIGLGDGGGSGDPDDNGQDRNLLLGKILRIDVNTTSAGKQYGVPSGNPFASGGGAPEVFAFGFRNPWRFSFDKANGTLFVGDVGQSAFEEIDIVTSGGNYGWNTMEGPNCFDPPSGCNMTGLTPPIFSYGRADGSTVIGGFVYRGTQIQGLPGAYIFTDFGNGRISALTGSGTNWTSTKLLDSGRSISSFGQGQDGELYVTDRAGSVLQIRP
jgi:glucose/arabinose dehydrogenase